MSWLQLSFITSKENSEIYGEWLSAAGALSVTLQDSLQQPLFEPAPGTTPLWDEIQLIALFEANTDREKIKNHLQILLDETTFKTLNMTTLADQNWTLAWMDQFHPMQFGQNLWICPSHTEIPNPKAINVLLDPGMAFGTGTHPSTRLCLEWLDAHPPIGKTVLDYGCGSGILGIAALKLGASFVYAVDNDPQALQSTQNNAKQNGYDEHQIFLNTPTTLTAKVDLLLANILVNPLIELAPKFAKLLQPNGIIVLSGILENQLPMILDCYSLDFNLLESTTLDGWVRVSFRHKS